jgi:hypothetical protein
MKSALILILVVASGFLLWSLAVNKPPKTVTRTPLPQKTSSASYQIEPSEAKIWQPHNIFQKFSVLLPPDWYQLSSDGSNGLTFGQGIKSYLTIRLGTTTIADELENSGRSYEHKILTVGNQTLNEYLVHGNCIEDVCDPGFNEIFLITHDQGLSFSYRSQDIDEKTIAWIAALTKSYNTPASP